MLVGRGENLGQVHVGWVPVEVLPQVWAALHRAGFVVTTSEAPDPSGDRVARCRRGDRELIIEIDTDPPRAFLVVAYPPYIDRPWRRGGDYRAFNDLTAVLDGLKTPSESGQ